LAGLSFDWVDLVRLAIDRMAAMPEADAC